MTVLKHGIRAALLVLDQLLVMLHLQRRHHRHLAFATMVQMALVLHLIGREVQKEVHGVTRVAPIVRNAVDVDARLRQVVVVVVVVVVAAAG